MQRTEQRAHEIVEELRADIDFEIDDVISRIVLGLPDDYYRILSHQEQMKHLKALLALGVCNVDQEITMQSEDERFVAVVGRKNYPGLLAKILKRLPNRQDLVAAKIFTSREQDFIIDLFEFRSESRRLQPDPEKNAEFEDQIRSVAKSTGHALDHISHFATQYAPNSPVLDDHDYLASQYLIFRRVLDEKELAVQIENEDKSIDQLTVASNSSGAFDVFEETVGYLANQRCDIKQAVLNDFACPNGNRVSIASFKLSKKDLQINISKVLKELTELLR